MRPSASTRRISPGGSSSILQTVTESANSLVVFVVTLFLLPRSDFSEADGRISPRLRFRRDFSFRGGGPGARRTRPDAVAREPPAWVQDRDLRARVLLSPALARAADRGRRGRGGDRSRRGWHAPPRPVPVASSLHELVEAREGRRGHGIAGRSQPAQLQERVLGDRAGRGARRGPDRGRDQGNALRRQSLGG